MSRFGGSSHLRDMRFVRLFGIVAVAAGAFSPATAAELEPRTAQAYEAYRVAARREFLARADRAPAPSSPTIATGPAMGDGILNVPGGLVHHWVGSVFVPGATVDGAVEVSQAYDAYDRIYTSVLQSRLLGRRGDAFQVMLRLKEGDMGVSAVLDIRSAVEYVRTSRGQVRVLSDSEEIREVRNAGRADERLLPVGRDSGYLWRAATFTRLVQLPDGVYVETETLGLSRSFPPFMGWIIEPIARRLGRKSVEASLREFAAAVRN